MAFSCIMFGFFFKPLRICSLPSSNFSPLILFQYRLYARLWSCLFPAYSVFPHYLVWPDLLTSYKLHHRQIQTRYFLSYSVFIFIIYVSRLKSIFLRTFPFRMPSQIMHAFREYTTNITRRHVFSLICTAVHFQMCFFKLIILVFFCL